ncbi:hypothetical protein [Paenibacillus sinopodophylli]|uniref:hypothetical protein n=1 Tax=Paenibacillus sinopodophylli TaxID=1837342 RepID=UPI0014874ECE|nr:hypothetical protein [Paenibacillus sinopodophylli]
MTKTSKQQERLVGGIDDGYLDNLNPDDPDFLEKYIAAITQPHELAEEEKK